MLENTKWALNSKRYLLMMYRRLSKVTTLVTFGFNSSWMTFTFAGSRYFHLAVTLEYQIEFVDVKK